MKQLTPRWIAMVTITVLTLYVVWLMLEPFINVLLWAIVLTVIASPVNRFLGRRIRSANLCALVTLLVVVFVVILPIAFVAQAVVSHADEAVDAFQAVFTKITNAESPHMRWLSRHVAIGELFKSENIYAQAKKLAGYLAVSGADIVGRMVLVVAQFLLVLFTTYYMLRDGGKLMVSARDMLPLKPEQADRIFKDIRTIVSASLSGTVLIAAIQGVLGGLAFWILGLPTPALWGVVMFFMSMVPVVGSSIIWVPAALYLAVSGSWIKALILVAWGIGAIGMVDNILRPVLVGSKTRMHELTVFFSVLGGIKLFGPVGIIIGPIVIAVAAGLLHVFRESGAEGDAVPVPAPVPAVAPTPAQS